MIINMCLAVPLKLIEINGNDGIGEANGITRRIRLDFINKAEIGDYVIVHAGFGIEKLLEEQGAEIQNAWLEVQDAVQKTD